MSVRARFFKKVQQKQNTPLPGDRGVDADVQAFCQRMDELVQQVQQWFDGSGVEVTVSMRCLQDLSTVGVSLSSGAFRYDIATLRLQNDARSVSILPEQLYQNGQKGCVTMTVNAPGRVPSRQRFYLSMEPEGGWYIQHEDQAKANTTMMTEDVFFQAIENLA